MIHQNRGRWPEKNGTRRARRLDCSSRQRGQHHLSGRAFSPIKPQRKTKIDTFIGENVDDLRYSAATAFWAASFTRRPSHEADDVPFGAFCKNILYDFVR